MDMVISKQRSHEARDETVRMDIMRDGGGQAGSSHSRSEEGKHTNQPQEVNMRNSSDFMAGRKAARGWTLPGNKK